MKIICEKLYSGDEKFAQFKSNFDSIYATLKNNIADLGREIKKQKGVVSQQKNSFITL